MSSLRILAANLATDSGVSVASAPTASVSFPATNLTDNRRDYYAEFATTSVVITFTMVDRVMDSVFVTSTNLAATDTIRVEAYSDDAKTTKVMDSTALAFVTATPWAGYVGSQNNAGVAYGTNYGTNTWSYHHTSEVTARKLDITITGTNPIRIGAVMFGVAWQFSDTTAGFSYGAQLQEVDTSKHVRSAGGSLITIPGYKYRKLTLPMDWLNERDRVSLLGHLRHAGRGNPIGVSCYSGDTTLIREDHTFVGRLSTHVTSSPTHAGNWKSSLVFEEG